MYHYRMKKFNSYICLAGLVALTSLFGCTQQQISFPNITVTQIDTPAEDQSSTPNLTPTPDGGALISWVEKDSVSSSLFFASWENGRVIPDAVTFPPDGSPNDHDWTFLAGQEISLINTGGVADYEILKELAELLIQSGVKSVGLIDLEHPLHWYVPERIAV